MISYLVYFYLLLMIKRTEIHHIKEYFWVKKIWFKGIVIIIIIVLLFYISKKYVDVYFLESQSDIKIENNIEVSNFNEKADARDIKYHTDQIIGFWNDIYKMNKYVQDKYISKEINIHTKEILINFIEREKIHLEMQKEENNRNKIEYDSSNLEISKSFSFPLDLVSDEKCFWDDFEKLWSDCKNFLPKLAPIFYSKYKNDDRYKTYYKTLWSGRLNDWWDYWKWWNLWVIIATAKWTPVYSISNWLVTQIAQTIAYWNVVSILHKTSKWDIISNYAHLSQVNVKEWDIVDNLTEIWKVWNWWNIDISWLRLQIDYPNLNHPFYYSYSTCRYSWYEIMEEWKCISDLKKFTIDPLEFISSQWDIEYSQPEITDYKDDDILKSFLDSLDSKTN